MKNELGCALPHGSEGVLSTLCLVCNDLATEKKCTPPELQEASPHCSDYWSGLLFSASCSNAFHFYHWISISHSHLTCHGLRKAQPCSSESLRNRNLSSETGISEPRNDIHQASMVLMKSVWSKDSSPWRGLHLESAQVEPLLSWAQTIDLVAFSQGSLVCIFPCSISSAPIDPHIISCLSWYNSYFASSALQEQPTHYKLPIVLTYLFWLCSCPRARKTLHKCHGR